MILEPIYEADFCQRSFGFRPNRRTMDAIKYADLNTIGNHRYFCFIEGDISSYFDEIGHRLLRRCLKKRIQDEQLLDLITCMLRCGVLDEGQLTYPTCGTPQGSIVSPLLANVFLHEFDDWYVRTYRVRPEWAHLAPTGLQYRRKKELGGTLMLTRYADDWVAVWNGSRARAEEIKSEIKTFFAEQLQLRLSEEKTLITHIDDGFNFLGYCLQGDQRWKDGQWCLFSRVPEKAVRRFRDAVTEITSHSFTDEVAAFTALSGLIRGWGNYYAYAAESRLMASLDAYVYQRIWQYCLEKNRHLGVKAIYRKYTLPPSLREAGHFQLGVIVGTQVIRLPRPSSISRKALRLPYPPHPYLYQGRDYVLPQPGTTDQRWWDQHIWAGQEGRRVGQRRLAVEVLARDAVCQSCGKQLAQEAHHDPPWEECEKHKPNQAIGVCQTCHRQLHRVARLKGEPGGSKGARRVRASG
jgi:RNA-directed DNA polymerase